VLLMKVPVLWDVALFIAWVVHDILRGPSIIIFRVSVVQMEWPRYPLHPEHDTTVILWNGMRGTRHQMTHCHIQQDRNLQHIF
jgi:hypothetical protein